VPDPAFADARLAALYDALNPWGPADDFYLGEILGAEAVLDVGCGTGVLLDAARRAGHRGRLTGADPAAGVLAVARARRPDVTWLLADAASVDPGPPVGLVTMTGHAFQVLLDDDATRAALTCLAGCLSPGGRLLFETRNPAARAWERWTPGKTRTTVLAPDGEPVEVHHRLLGTQAPDLVEFVTEFRWTRSGATASSPSTLRFPGPESLRAQLDDAGFDVTACYGDWDRSPLRSASPEVVVSAVRR